MEDKKIIANAHRYFKIGIIICVLALLFSPFLPWLGYTTEEYKKDSEDKETVTRFLGEATIHIYAESNPSGDFGDAIEDLSDNIGMVTAFLWLTLIFLILGYLGVIFYKVGRRFEMAGKILVLIGCFALIFAILCVVFNGLCFMNVMDLQEAVEEGYDDSSDAPEYFLGYNYVPLIASILLMFIGIFLMLRIFPPTIRSFRSYYYSYPPQPYQSGPYGAPPPPPPPPDDEGFGCPNCGAAIPAGMAYCSQCGASAPPRPPPPPPPSPQRREPMRRMTVFKCPLCEAIIMAPNNCPYCGWRK